MQDYLPLRESIRIVGEDAPKRHIIAQHVEKLLRSSYVVVQALRLCQSSALT
jgi:hypothetical protein